MKSNPKHSINIVLGLIIALALIGVGGVGGAYVSKQNHPVAVVGTTNTLDSLSSENQAKNHPEQVPMPAPTIYASTQGVGELGATPEPDTDPAMTPEATTKESYQHEIDDTEVNPFATKEEMKETLVDGTCATSLLFRIDCLNLLLAEDIDWSIDDILDLSDRAVEQVYQAEHTATYDAESDDATMFRKQFCSKYQAKLERAGVYDMCLIGQAGE